MTTISAQNKKVSHIKIALFTIQILDSFHKAKDRACIALLQQSNHVDADDFSGDEANKMSCVYSKLAILNELESQFLELINQFPEKISDEIIKNYDQFYRAFTEWRFQ